MRVWPRGMEPWCILVPWLCCLSWVAAGAQHPVNLVPNGDFSGGLAGWFPLTSDLAGEVAVRSADGNGYAEISSPADPVFELPPGKPGLQLFSSWFVGADEVLSVRLRARGRGVLNICLGGVSAETCLYTRMDPKTFHVGETWTNIAFALRKTDDLRFPATQLELNAEGRVDIDDVVVLPGGTDLAQRPHVAQPAGLSLECANPTRIHKTGEAVAFLVQPYHVPANPSGAVWRVTDYFDRDVAHGTLELPVDGKPRKLVLPFAEPGYYRLHCARGDVEATAAFVVVGPAPARLDPRFGVCCAAYDPAVTARKIRALGVGSLRVHGPLTWNRLMPRRGTFHPPIRLLKTLKASGAEVMSYVHGQAPPWVQEDTGEVFNLDAARRMITRTVQATSNLVDQYEIYNEPNSHVPFGGAPGVYAAWLATAYDAVKAVSPKNGVIGICAGQIDAAYIDGVLRRGVASKMDALSVHPYRYDPPEATHLFDEIDYLYDVLEKHDYKGPVWASEVGFQGNDRPQKPNRHPHNPVFSEAEAARHQVKLNLMCFSAGFDRFYWFFLHGVAGGAIPFYWGLYYENPEHAIPKKSVAALATLTRTLNHLPFRDRCVRADPDLYAYDFRDASRGVIAAFKAEAVADGRFLFVRDIAGVEGLRTIDGAEAAPVWRTEDLLVRDVGRDPSYMLYRAAHPPRVVEPLYLTRFPDTLLDGARYSLSLQVRNPLPEPTEAGVRIALPAGWTVNASPERTVFLKSDEAKTIDLEFAIPEDESGPAPTIEVTARFAALPDFPVRLVRAVEVIPQKYRDRAPLRLDPREMDWTVRTRWADDGWSVAKEEDRAVFSFRFSGKRQDWGAFRSPCDGGRNLKGYRKVDMELLFDNPEKLTFSILLEEAGGALYRGVPHVIPEKLDAWQRLSVELRTFRHIRAAGEDENNMLDLDSITAVHLHAISSRQGSGYFAARSICFKR
ncbi:MAG: hypothetical protein JW951_02695 [Lentisphaerae bacterium]|nr:hypothetical protein [Lentisphaerota bacterium]